MVRVSSFARLFVLVVVMGCLGTNCIAATVPTIKLPKKTITVYTVTIAKPTGDPVAAGSADNEFTFSGAAGVATIPVEATVQPARLATKVGDMIKWTFVSVPAGSALTWSNSWPGESTAGRGATAVATLTGYPTSNNQFGARTIKMEVIRNGKAIITKTANIELFFERDRVATGRSVPNWYHYWSQTTANAGTHVWVAGGGSGYTSFEGGSWVAHVQQAQGHTLGGTWGNAEGIDLFANLVRHELQHVADMSSLWGANQNRDPAADADGDFLPGVREPTLVSGHPYDPANPATYPDRFNYLAPGTPGNLWDAEDYALSREPAWTNGAANSQDWASPGMQHLTIGDSDD